MLTNNSKSYISYLNELVDRYNYTYYHFINRKRFNAGYSALAEKIENNLKSSKFKIIDRVNCKWFIIQNQAAILEINSKDAIWEEPDYDTSADTSDLAAKNYFIALEAEVDKLVIAKFGCL